MFNENMPIQANYIHETRLAVSDVLATIALAFLMPVALNSFFALIGA